MSCFFSFFEISGHYLSDLSSILEIIFLFLYGGQREIGRSCKPQNVKNEILNNMYEK